MMFEFIEYAMSVSEWPSLIRKLFVILFPITVPLYCMFGAIVMFLMLLLILIAQPIEIMADIWNGKSHQ